MCGIIGYVGSRQATPLLVGGLRKLEYRGYDSAGVSVFDRTTSTSRVVRCRGKLSALEAKLLKEPAPGTIGIGHTRWATHGLTVRTRTAIRNKVRADQRHSQRHHREPHSRCAYRARRRWRKVLRRQDGYRDLRALGRAPDRGWRAGSHDRGCARRSRKCAAATRSS